MILPSLMNKCQHICTVCLITLCLFAGGRLRADTTTSDSVFKVYEADFSQGALATPSIPGLGNPAKDVVLTKEATGSQVTVRDTGEWRGFWGVASLGTWAGFVPLNGGDHVHVASIFSTTSPGKAAATAVLLVQYYGGETVQIAGAGDLPADGQAHEIEYTLPADASKKRICALWLHLTNGGPGAASFLLQKFWIERTRVNNRLNADRILQTPPPHNARVQPVQGQMALTLDGQPISGLGWASILNNTTGDAELHDITGASGFRLTRLVFTLGEQIPLQLYPPSWLGPDQFDFSYLDSQLARIQKANPDAKVFLNVALDGAQWWVWMHPNAGSGDAPSGIPDYLSPEWRRDSRDAIRQMVAHVQTSPYSGMVIGYQLFNGATEDCGFPVDVTTPGALGRYHGFLRRKYGSDADLQAAWHKSGVTIDAALAQMTPAEQKQKTPYVPPGVDTLLFQPVLAPELQDKMEFLNHSYQQVILNFAHDIKEATQGRAVVGARTGNLMGNIWDWPYMLETQSPINELLLSPDFDMLEVQESYFGRGIGDYGSGAPIDPPQGMMAHNKLLMIQNDVRTFLSAPTEGFGRTPDLPTTLQMQRRIFANSLVHGMEEYLWQQSYHYNDPAMLADFQKMQTIDLKALHAPRDTGAQIAFVFDSNYRRFFGCDPLKDAPSRGEPLFDYLKFTWARAGVPYDMIFLDQLLKAKPYKVYVFVHTVGLTDAQSAMIKQVTCRDGKVSIFIWADGLIDGQKVNLAKMNDLIGMKLALSPKPSAWKMSPTTWFQQKAGVNANYPMGTLAIQEPSEPNAANDTFAPSFSVSDPTVRPLAVYGPGSPLAGATGVSVKDAADYTTIYSASPNLSPALLRYALARAGAFSYTDTPDNCYIDDSFLGINARQTPPAHVVHVRLPKPSGLYEVFRDEELKPSDHFDIPVDKGQTYLYYRGSKAQWEALKPN